jgi:N-methylhydantoinase A
VTVTDAHLWLGRLPADAFLGGEARLDRQAVAGPLADLAGRLGATPEQTAEGVIEVADSAMERALRVISVERGYDPADFTLVAFGGAGALHVAELATRLGAARALVPPDPGLLSAYGMLAAPLTREASQTVLVANDAGGYRERIAEALESLEAAVLPALLEEGGDPARTVVERWVDARYRGQSFELRVPVERWETGGGERRSAKPGGEEDERWEERFHRAHELRYGYRRDSAPVEAVTVRVLARAPGPPLEAGRIEEASAPPPLVGGLVRFGGESLETPRAWRRDLRAGHALHGPLLVQEYSATTWVPPGWRMEVDAWGSLHLLPG